MTPAATAVHSARVQNVSCRVCDAPLADDAQTDRCSVCQALTSRRIARAAIDRAQAAVLVER